MTDVAYPFAIDPRGRTALAQSDDHLRQMIEQVLFTALGERVNRPTFGCGLTQLLFAPNDTALAAAVNVTVQSPIAACSAISDEVGRLAAYGTSRQFVEAHQFGRY